jgi:hypothetical protein
MVQKTFASWKRPSTKDNHGPSFKARPIKHWRKQLCSGNKSGRASIGMPMDRPGGSSVTSAVCRPGVQYEFARIDNVQSTCHVTRQASTIVGPLKISKCETIYSPRGAESSSTHILQKKIEALQNEQDKPTFVVHTTCQRKHLVGRKTLCF